jgi:hypothetical protein
MPEKYDDWFEQHFKGAINIENKTNVDRIKAILLGPPGSGKSWLLTTARKPVYIADSDDRIESIAGKPGIFVKKYIDKDPNQPQGWAELDSDIGTMEYLKEKNELKIKSFGLDTLNGFYGIAQNQMIAESGASSMFRKMRIGTKEYRIPQGWDSINYTKRMLDGLLNRLFALDIDVYCTAHIRRQKAADSTEDNPKFTGKWTVEPQNIEFLISKFNERWMMKEEFKVQTKPDWEFNAITALNIDALEEPNIEKMLEKHNSRLPK